MKRKLLLTLLAVILSILPTFVNAATEIDGIYYNLNTSNKTAEVTNTSALGVYKGDIIIPESVQYNNEEYCVTSIGQNAFNNRGLLSSVTIPNTVTSIGAGAFCGCHSLTSIVIPNSVISIGDGAFQMAGLTTSITIPKSVTSIGVNLFYQCSMLPSISVESGNPAYDSRENCNAIIETSSNTLIAGCKSSVIPNSVTSIADYAFVGSGLMSISIPNSVTSIGNYAFKDCSLTSVTIPNSVTSIGQNAFSGCKLKSVTILCPTIGTSFKGFSTIKDITIGNSVTSIGDDAFKGCSGLTSITIPNSVTSIGSSAFSGCSGLTSVTIPNSVTSIGESAFYYCSALTSITIPNSVTTINNNTFSYCTKLTSITIPEGVTSIASAFFNCKGLTSVTIPSSVTSISDGAFSACNLTSVTINSDDIVSTNWTKNNNFKNIFGYIVREYVIGDGVTSIGNYAFRDCSGLTSITIPNSVTSIGNSAFSGCSGLTSITIPNSVTSIGDDAFNGCSGLTSVNISDLAVWCNISFESAYSNPCYSAHHLYLNGMEVKDLVIPNSVTSIGERAFSGCSGLTSVTIGNSVTSIGNWAFEGCSGLTSVSIPNSVTSIGSAAFYGCSGLTSVTIGNSVTSVGSSAFSGCSGLTSVSIPNSVTSIGSAAFYNCSGLTSVTIPNSVTSIGNSAFYGCSGLTSITIGNSVTSIGSGVFYNCISLAKIKTEDSTPLSIQSNTFSNYGKLFVPKGSRSSYASANYWKEFTIKEYPNSDVNEDNITDVVDVVDIARFVVAISSASFEEFLADMNGDRYVNIADAIVLVNEIAGNTQFAKPALAPRKLASDMLALFGDGSNLSLEMEGNGDYAAFQFDLWLPADMDLMQVSLNDARRQGHQLLYNKMGDGHYRVVALSTSGNVFNGTSGELLSMTLDDFATDDVRIDNIHFVTARGIDVPFEAIGVCNGNNGVTTDIHSVDSNNTTKPVYNLNGQRLTAPRKGLNIIGGKKIVVK